MPIHINAVINCETEHNLQKIQDLRASGRRSRRVLYGQKTKVPRVMRINLIIVTK